MPNLTINLDNGGQSMTVSQMRKRLAQVLSGLRGDQEVSFGFTARLPHYAPNPPLATVVYGELARPEND